MEQNSSSSRKTDMQVLEPEIIEPGDYRQQTHGHGQRFFYRTHGFTTSGARFWAVGNHYSGGFLSPAITLFLFLLTLVQYGLLAAIGFMFFYIIGSILGTVYQAKKLVEGIVTKPWGWRFWNWAISFILTVWLAGGFND